MAPKTAAEVLETVMIQITITAVKNQHTDIQALCSRGVGLCPNIPLTIFLSIDFTEKAYAMKPRQKEFMRSVSNTDPTARIRNSELFGHVDQVGSDNN